MVLRFPIKVASMFLDLVCSVHVVTITNRVNYGSMISLKNGFYISGPSMFSTYDNHYKMAQL